LSIISCILSCNALLRRLVTRVFCRDLVQAVTRSDRKLWTLILSPILWMHNEYNRAMTRLGRSPSGNRILCIFYLSVLCTQFLALFWYVCILRLVISTHVYFGENAQFSATVTCLLWGYCLKHLVRTTVENRTTKTANIKKALLLSSTSPCSQCAICFPFLAPAYQGGR